MNVMYIFFFTVDSCEDVSMGYLEDGWYDCGIGRLRFD